MNENFNFDLNQPVEREVRQSPSAQTAPSPVLTEYELASWQALHGHSRNVFLDRASKLRHAMESFVASGRLQSAATEDVNTLARLRADASQLKKDITQEWRTELVHEIDGWHVQQRANLDAYIVKIFDKTFGASNGPVSDATVTARKELGL